MTSSFRFSTWDAFTMQSRKRPLEKVRQGQHWPFFIRLCGCFPSRNLGLCWRQTASLLYEECRATRETDPDFDPDEVEVTEAEQMLEAVETLRTMNKVWWLFLSFAVVALWRLQT